MSVLIAYDTKNQKVNDVITFEKYIQLYKFKNNR